MGIRFVALIGLSVIAIVLLESMNNQIVKQDTRITMLLTLYAVFHIGRLVEQLIQKLKQ